MSTTFRVSPKAVMTQLLNTTIFKDIDDRSMSQLRPMLQSYNDFGSLNWCIHCIYRPFNAKLALGKSRQVDRLHAYLYFSWHALPVFESFRYSIHGSFRTWQNMAISISSSISISPIQLVSIIFVTFRLTFVPSHGAATYTSSEEHFSTYYAWLRSIVSRIRIRLLFGTLSPLYVYDPDSRYGLRYSIMTYPTT